MTTNLDKTDGSRLLAEALTAEIEAILANKASLVGAEAAVNEGDGKYQSRRSRPQRPQGHAPLTAPLSKLSGTRKPNSVVCHFVDSMICIVLG